MSEQLKSVDEVQETVDKKIVNPSAVVSEEDLKLMDQEIPGIDNDVTKKWKEQYGRVFFFYFLGNPYAYRSFTWKEFLEVRNELSAQAEQSGGQPTDFALKMEMLKKCVLWPKNFIQKLDDPSASIPGAIPIVLADYIMSASGFVDIIPDVATDKPSTVDRMVTAAQEGPTDGNTAG